MPFRTVGEDLTKFVEDLVTAAQKQRMHKGPMAEMRKARRRSLTDQALDMIKKTNFRKAGILEHGERVLAERVGYADTIKIAVVRIDGRTAMRELNEVHLMGLNKTALALEFVRAIRSADHELGKPEVSHG